MTHPNNLINTNKKLQEKSRYNMYTSNSTANVIPEIERDNSKCILGSLSPVTSTEIHNMEAKKAKERIDLIKMIISCTNIINAIEFFMATMERIFDASVYTHKDTAVQRLRLVVKGIDLANNSELRVLSDKLAKYLEYLEENETKETPQQWKDIQEDVLDIIVCSQRADAPLSNANCSACLHIYKHKSKCSNSKHNEEFCNREEHLKDICYTKQDTIPAVRYLRDPIVDNTKNNPFRMMASIGNINTMCLLDSGTDVNLMGRKTYNELKGSAHFIEDKETTFSFNTINLSPKDNIKAYRKVLARLICKEEYFGHQTFYVIPNDNIDTLLDRKITLRMVIQGKVDIDKEACLREIEEEIRKYEQPQSNIYYVNPHKSASEMTQSKADNLSAYEDVNVQSLGVEDVGCYSALYKQMKAAYGKSLYTNSSMSATEIHDILQEISLIRKTSKITPVVIDTEPGAKAYEHRNISKKKIAIAEEKVKELVREKFVVPAKRNDWLIPIHMVEEADNSWRFCLDLRQLNTYTQQDNYPLPSIITFTDDLLDMKYFTRISIKDGFFQVPLAQESQHKVTFKVGQSCYKFAVLPIGYRNATNIFQRTMENILQGMIGIICRVYIADILIYSEDLATHKEHIKKVLRKLKEYGMDINWEKSEMAKTEMEFLGYHIGKNIIRPVESRIQGILNYPEPKNKTELRRFIGLLGYNRRFLHNIAETLRPLHNLTKKDKEWSWSGPHQRAFEEAKQKLTSATELTIPDYTKKFILETSATDTSVSAVLEQEGGVICYYSATLTEIQSKYSISEKELYAVVWGIEKCKYYLQGVEFYLITKYQILSIQKRPDLGNSRISRWYQKLNEYTYISGYEKGEEEIPQTNSYSIHLNDSEEPTAHNGVHAHLAKLYNTRDQPLTGKEIVILKKHKEWEHRKIIKTALREDSIQVSSKALAKILERCQVCLENKDKKLYSNTSVETNSPGELMVIDLMYHDNFYIVVMFDYFTRKIFAKSISMEEEYKILTYIQTVYKKMPFQMLLSDRKTEFKDPNLKNWLNSKGVEHELRPAYPSKEMRRIKLIERRLAKEIEERDGFIGIKKLENITKSYNNKKHQSIGMTPNQAIYDSNWDQVRQNVINQKIQNSFKKIPQLKIGEKVLFKSNIRNDSNNNQFDRAGTIVEQRTFNSYLIAAGAGSALILRHYNHIKIIPVDIIY
ncbi:hypothetical protein NEFER03_1506 [Nematocida sp. LUAm3]|nr:hypothetical protein NEFER03_1506 [Nematocida sp. LUAm3]KAI5174539.1 hypothetical protein NEFER02_0660 [Nematocida sp. LUAm2]KAI5178055.1 hypothetical protein NEFER01_1237 [Nematocida sp. LUAm1]